MPNGRTGSKKPGGSSTSTAFASIFWFCNVAPYFAIFTFAPLVFSTLQISDERISTITANALAAAGAVAGMLIIDRAGRRRTLIVCFWVATITLALVGGWSAAPGIIVVLCFALFSLFARHPGHRGGPRPLIEHNATPLSAAISGRAMAAGEPVGSALTGGSPLGYETSRRPKGWAEQEDTEFRWAPSASAL